MDAAAKWREAHPGIIVTDDMLATMAPFASLHANDFAVYMAAKGYGTEAVEFVKAISRELVWAYDNWQKAQRDGKPAELLTDMLNQCGEAPYDFVARFIRDYAKANNITLVPLRDRAAWESILPPEQLTP